MARTLPEIYTIGLTAGKAFYLVRAELGAGESAPATTAYWSSISGIEDGGLTANYSGDEQEVSPSITALAGYVGTVDGVQPIEGIGEIDSSIDTTNGGGFGNVSETVIRFLNTTGFHNYINQYQIENRPIEIWEGFVTGSTDTITITSDMVNIFKGVMTDTGTQDYDIYEISAIDYSGYDQKLIPDMKLTQDGFPNAHPDDYGKVVPLLFGDFENYSEEVVGTLLTDAGGTTSLTGAYVARYQLGDVISAPIIQVNHGNWIGFCSSTATLTGVQVVWVHDKDRNWVGHIDANPNTTYIVQSASAAEAGGGSEQAAWRGTVSGSLRDRDVHYVRFKSFNPRGNVYLRPLLSGDLATKDQTPALNPKGAVDFDLSTTSRIEGTSIVHWAFDNFTEPGTMLNHTATSQTYDFQVGIIYKTSKVDEAWNLYAVSSGDNVIVDPIKHLPPTTGGEIAIDVINYTGTAFYSAMTWDELKTLSFAITADDVLNAGQLYVYEIWCQARNIFNITGNKPYEFARSIGWHYRIGRNPDSELGWSFFRHPYNIVHRANIPATNLSNMSIGLSGAKFSTWIDSV